VAEPTGIPANGLNVGAIRSLQLLTESLLRDLQRAYRPLRVGLSPAEQSAHRARVEEANRQRERQVSVALSTALVDWECTRTLLADNRPALAALGVHRPQRGYYRAECSECQESDGCEDVAAVEWPCGTYTAIKGASGG
jgi:hypothetical protein